MKYCWRLTDNRHWDSPGRMSDGRVFTDWRSACAMNNAIASKAGIASGLSQKYSQMLQETQGAETARRMAEVRAATGDPWGRSYVPPPPRDLIVPVARQGVDIIQQSLPGAIGADVRSGPGSVRMTGDVSQEDTRISDCGRPAMPRCDPRWGLSPQTLVLNLRDSAPQGGSTTGWLRSTLDDDEYV